MDNKRCFECIKGCSDCCGVIVIPAQIWQRNKPPTENAHLAEGNVQFDELGNALQLTTDGKCIFLDRQTNRCTIYNDRPQVCKDFGMSDNLPCPYLKPNGNPRTEAAQKQIMRIYKNNALNGVVR